MECKRASAACKCVCVYESLLLANSLGEDTEFQVLKCMYLKIENIAEPFDGGVCKECAIFVSKKFSGKNYIIGDLVKKKSWEKWNE